MNFSLKLIHNTSLILKWSLFPPIYSLCGEPVNAHTIKVYIRRLSMYANVLENKVHFGLKSLS